MLPLTRAACTGDPNPQPESSVPRCDLCLDGRGVSTLPPLLTIPDTALFLHPVVVDSRLIPPRRLDYLSAVGRRREGGSDVEECAIPCSPLFLGFSWRATLPPLPILKQPKVGRDRESVVARKRTSAGRLGGGAGLH